MTTQTQSHDHTMLYTLGMGAAMIVIAVTALWFYAH